MLPASNGDAPAMPSTEREGDDRHLYLRVFAETSSGEDGDERRTTWAAPIPAIGLVTDKVSTVTATLSAISGLDPDRI
ncbi:hypothetical protein VTN00DRAFT_5789 [Thermoascus crustaceus]|uniref:uncharacterized protein n=1 Tax=Thermoascus crustaceus TaxID=5088 RepID=UPI0037433448